MGSCQSSSDDTEIPKLPPSILENKFKTIEKRTFEIPNEINIKLETHTVNGTQPIIKAELQILSPKM